MEDIRSSGARPVVSTRDGALRGRARRTPEGTKYFSFQGIPYARPPVGDLRFKSPELPEKWAGVRDAGREGRICTQYNLQLKLLPNSLSIEDISAYLVTLPACFHRIRQVLRQDEDCLYLNVYSPELPSPNSSPAIPVLFWIHGGGFVFGDGDEDIFGPEYFLDKGVVVVTINYRLGPFGFFSVGTEAAPGNYGLKDQCLALKWVRDNVAAFGGDPNRVTLCGESAGAVCAHIHMLSPKSRGLFHGVILSSGNAMYDWVILTHQAKTRARDFAKSLGIEATDPEEVVAALRRKGARQLMNAANRLKLRDRFRAVSVIAFMPVVEPPGPDAFLSEHPSAILARGEQAPVPLVLGVNNCEGMLWYMGDPLHGLITNPVAEIRKQMEKKETFIPEDLYEAMSPEQREDCVQEVLHFYCGDKGICMETFSAFLDFVGDVMFYNRLHGMSRLHCAQGKAPVFAYRFSYEGKLGFFKRLFRIKQEGVAHADELGYLFRSKILPDLHLPPDSPDIRCRDTFVTLWTNFVKTGHPTPPEATEELEATWMPATENNMNYLDIGESLNMRADRLFKERFEFWNALYRKYTGVLLLD